MNRIPNNVLGLRLKVGAARSTPYTQAELARLIGIPAYRVNMIERGVVLPTSVELAAIATELGCAPQDLYSETFLAAIAEAETVSEQAAAGPTK